LKSFVHPASRFQCPLGRGGGYREVPHLAARTALALAVKVERKAWLGEGEFKARQNGGAGSLP
jgi:hypothetical protein